MSAPSGYSRDQLRQAYTDAWRKHADRAPLSPQEAAIAEVIALHPEYHALVSDPDSALAFDAAGRADRQNPFLHMGLHLAVRDQVAVDRPPGIRSLYRELQARHGDAHAAEHALMESLGEVLWQAQRGNRPPDEQQYLALARRRAI
ncbi:MAG: DUF1841 family protein [Steroidobacterales bacterium]